MGSTPTQNPGLQFVSAEHKLNATLIQGHKLIAVLAYAGAANPRLYAEPNVAQAGYTLFVPETRLEKPAEWTDTSRNLTDLGVDQNMAINLSYAVDQDLQDGNPPAERNVAEALVWLNNADPVFGLTEFLKANPFLPESAQNGGQVALLLPGVKAAISAGLAALAKPR